MKKKAGLKDYLSMDQCQLYLWVLVGYSKFYPFQYIINTFYQNIEVIITEAIHKYGRIVSNYKSNYQSVSYPKPGLKHNAKLIMQITTHRHIV